MTGGGIQILVRVYVKPTAIILSVSRDNKVGARSQSQAGQIDPYIVRFNPTCNFCLLSDLYSLTDGLLCNYKLQISAGG